MRSGIDPVVVGLAMGLLTYASPAARADLERATDLFKLFREQPTPELARTASAGLQSAISPNERLQQLYHPWTSYVIVPLFALANAGIAINGSFLAHAYGSPITLGILLGYVLGKPVGIVGASSLLAHAEPRPAAAAGRLGGARRRRDDRRHRLHRLAADREPRLPRRRRSTRRSSACSAPRCCASALDLARLPRHRPAADRGCGSARCSAAPRCSSTSPSPSIPERDHIRGPAEAPVTLLEYGDLECPYCGQAEPAIRALLADRGDLRYVWRHLPLSDVHPQAQQAAEAAEAAGEPGRVLGDARPALRAPGRAAPPRPDRLRAASSASTASASPTTCASHAGAGRVAEDVDSADLSGVSGTPTFFINGRRHYGAYDLDSLDGGGEARARAGGRELTARSRYARAPWRRSVSATSTALDARHRPARCQA